MRNISRSEGVEVVDQGEPAAVTIGPAIGGVGTRTHSSLRFHQKNIL